MLRKLMKYEIYAMGRILLPLYLLVLVACGALAADLRLDKGLSGQGSVVFVLLVILFSVSIMAMLVVSVIMVIQRFYKNLLGDEGYLMFSLPVSTAQNILSKALSALIWTVLGFLTGIACGFILTWFLGDVSVFLNDVKGVWTMVLISMGKGKARFLLCVSILALILGVLEAIVKVYAAFSVGHQWGNHRILGSILAYIGFDIVETILARFLPFRRMLEEPLVIAESAEGQNAAAAGLNASAAVMEQMLGYSKYIALIALAGVLIYGGITWFLLDRRLNLE